MIFHIFRTDPSRNALSSSRHLLLSLTPSALRGGSVMIPVFLNIDPENKTVFGKTVFILSRWTATLKGEPAAKKKGTTSPCRGGRQSAIWTAKAGLDRMGQSGWKEDFSDVEPEVHDIAIPDGIIFPFDRDFAGFPAGLF